MTIKNLAMGIVVTAPSPATSGTTLTLRAGEGAYMPPVPFLATTAPPDQLSNPDYAEIVLVTAVSTDTLTIVRGKRGSTAKSIATGWIIANGVYVEDVQGIDVAVATAATTVAKIGTTAEGDYSPAKGDTINVSFATGCNATSPTLNIDGSGVKTIRLGNVNVNTTLVSTATALILKMWYDGTYWQIYGSLKNDNTTYAEIADAALALSSSTTTGLITGRRMDYYKQNSLIIDEDNMASDLTTKMPSQQSVKAYVDTRGSNSVITGETPTGLVNGTNTTFTTSVAYVGGSLSVFINGINQKRTTHFTETTPGSGIFTMDDAPLTGDVITVNYQFTSGTTGNADTVDSYHANATPTANTIPVLNGSAKLPFSATAQLNYSATEQDTGIKWIDGKTVYQKTIDTGLLPNATTKTVSHGISDMDTLCDMSGVARNSAGGTYLVLPFYHSAVNGVQLNLSGINISISSSFNWSAYSSYVTIIYTRI